MNETLQIDATDGRRFARLRALRDGVTVELWRQATIRKPAKLIGRMTRYKPFHVVCNEVHDTIDHIDERLAA